MTQPQITLTRTRYLVALNGTIHHVRRDRACDCGGTPTNPCPAIPLVRDYLAGGGPRPLGRHPDTWPASWVRIPSSCPVCDCPTVADRYLTSRAGPGWRCSLEPMHFWQVRAEPLRRQLRATPPQPCYPWHDAPQEERRAWLQAHHHPPRLVPATEPEGELPTMPKYRIFYARQPTFHPSGQFGIPRLTISILLHSHPHLGEVEGDGQDDVWRRMQGEHWPPNGEARSFLERLGLRHTSISVGDMLQDEEGTYWECVEGGWRCIEEISQGGNGHGQTQPP